MLRQTSLFPGTSYRIQSTEDEGLALRRHLPFLLANRWRCSCDKILTRMTHEKSSEGLPENVPLLAKIKHRKGSPLFQEMVLRLGYSVANLRPQKLLWWRPFQEEGEPKRWQETGSLMTSTGQGMRRPLSPPILGLQITGEETSTLELYISADVMVCTVRTGTRRRQACASPARRTWGQHGQHLETALEKASRQDFCYKQSEAS